MKKFNFLLLALLLAVLPTLQSCDDNDGYSLGDFSIDWATVSVTGGDTYSLMADNWGSLWPAATAVPGYKPVDGQRVLVWFNPLSDNVGSDYDHYIKVEWVRNILTKQVEELTAENESEFGNDSVLIYKGNMWIAGGYLNIIFAQDLPAKDKHRVSLVENTTAVPADDGYIHLEYRYNTYGDTTGYWVNGAVSFNLNSLNLDGKKGIKVKLNSVENGEVEVTFDVKDQTMPESAKNTTLSEEVKVK